MRYRRIKTKGGTYFFTVATHKRKSLFSDADNIKLLRESFKRVIDKFPFIIDAIVVLPDHLHCIWTLPEDDSDYTTRWRFIKSNFSRDYKRKFNIQGNKFKIWQKRFWEHYIRDNKDFRVHMDYIHYNPVKHGFVDAPIEWKSSSFARSVRKGEYHKYWGKSHDIEFSENIGNE